MPDKKLPALGRLLLRTTIPVLVGLAAWMVSPAASLASVTGKCAPAGGAHFTCGVTNVEDFAPIPGTHWVIGSDLAAEGQQGFLYVFDTRNGHATAVQPASIAIRPDKQHYPDCPGPVDMKLFGPHGLDLTRGNGAHRTLYAVNHGGRESVEVFTVDSGKGTPHFTWTGCIVAPHGFWPDAAASLPDGGIIVTSLWDPTDPKRLDKLMQGQPVGALDEWQPGKGWSEVPGSSGMSGPNGVIVTPDGKQVYVAVWSGKEVARISRGGPEAKMDTVPTGILTDNLRWSPDGKTILVGGQDASVKQVLDCFGSKAVNCNVPFRIDTMDPQTLKLTTLIKSGVYGRMGAGTGAIEVGHSIWVSTFRADRIAIFPAPKHQGM